MSDTRVINSCFDSYQYSVNIKRQCFSDWSDTYNWLNETNLKFDNDFIITHYILIIEERFYHFKESQNAVLFKLVFG